MHTYKHVHTRIFPELRAGFEGAEGGRRNAETPPDTDSCVFLLHLCFTDTCAILYPLDLVCYEHFSKSLLCRTMPFLTAPPKPRKGHLCTRACVQLLGTGSQGERHHVQTLTAPRRHQHPHGSQPAALGSHSKQKQSPRVPTNHISGRPHRRHARSGYSNPFPKGPTSIDFLEMRI